MLHSKICALSNRLSLISFQIIQNTVDSLLPLRNGIVPSISVSKDVTVTSNYNPSTWAIKPEETQEGKEDLSSSSLSDFSHSSQCALRKLQMWKQGTDCRWVRCITKKWFQWAWALSSSHTKKSIKFLNLRYLVLFN